MAEGRPPVMVASHLQTQLSRFPSSLLDCPCLESHLGKLVRLQKFNLKKAAGIHSSYMETATTSIQVAVSVSSTLYKSVVWLSVSPLRDSLSVPPSQLFSSGSLTIWGEPLSLAPGLKKTNIISEPEEKSCEGGTDKESRNGDTLSQTTDL